MCAGQCQGQQMTRCQDQPSRHTTLPVSRWSQHTARWTMHNIYCKMFKTFCGICAKTKCLCCPRYVKSLTGWQLLNIGHMNTLNDGRHVHSYCSSSTLNNRDWWPMFYLLHGGKIKWKITEADIAQDYHSWKSSTNIVLRLTCGTHLKT